MATIENTPRLFRVRNLSTMEVFNLFSTSKEAAVSACPIGAFDEVEVEEVLVTTEDGCTNRVFQLRSIPPSAGGIFFRTVNANTLKPGKTVFIKKVGDYDRSRGKYCCIQWDNISKSREFKPQQWVITEFTF